MAGQLLMCSHLDTVAIALIISFDLHLPDYLSSPPSVLTFTSEEKEQMRKFSNRSYMLDTETRYHIWLGLVDIILAYVYDVRTTEGEHNVSALSFDRNASGCQ